MSLHPTLLKVARKDDDFAPLGTPKLFGATMRDPLAWPARRSWRSWPNPSAYRSVGSCRGGSHASGGRQRVCHGSSDLCQTLNGPDKLRGRHGEGSRCRRCRRRHRKQTLAVFWQRSEDMGQRGHVSLSVLPVPMPRSASDVLILLVNGISFVYWYRGSQFMS